MRCPRHDWLETGALGWGRDPGRPVLRCANCKKKRGMTPHEYELWGEGYTWKVIGATTEPQTETERGETSRGVALHIGALDRVY